MYKLLVQWQKEQVEHNTKTLLLDLKEIGKFMGLLFANVVCPKPQFPMWFKSTRDHKIFGNNFFAFPLIKRSLDPRTRLRVCNV